MSRGKSVADSAAATVELTRECVAALERALAQPESKDALRLAAVCADQVRDAAAGLHSVLKVFANERER